ncbi:MAG: autotransporter-associated beta strand repeat-containing protein [Chlamydiia bacterium]
MKILHCFHVFTFLYGFFLFAANLPVTSTATSGPGSLVQIATLAADGDTIQMNTGGFATITLQSATPLNITKSISLTDIGGTINITGGLPVPFLIDLSTSGFSPPSFNVGVSTMTASNLLILGGPLQFADAGVKSNFNINSVNASIQGRISLGANWDFNFNLDPSGNNSSFAGLILRTNNSINVASGKTVSSAGSITGLDLTKSGAGTLSISGSIAYTGATTINDGTLSISNNTAYTGATTINGSSTLVLSGSGAIANTSSVTLTGSGTINTTGVTTQATLIELNGGSTLASINLGAKPLNLTINTSRSYSGIFSGSATVTKAGSPTATLTLLTNSPLLTGAFNVSAGTVAISGAGGLSAISGMAMGVNTTLNISGVTNTVTLTNLTVADATNTIQLGAKTLQINVTVNNTNRASIVDSGLGGSLIKSGAFTLTLGGTSTYQGPTVINAGTLALGGSGSIANSANLALLANTTFDASAVTLGTVTVGNLISTQSTSVITIGSNILETNNTTTVTFAGVIRGTGGLNRTGAGSLLLSGVNLYTGPTILNGTGTLSLINGGRINPNSSLTINDGTFDISSVTPGGSTITISNLRGTAITGTISLGAQLIQLNNSIDTTFPGSISGTGSLIKTGSNTLTLSQLNSYSGGTTITGTGTLALSGVSNIGTGPVLLTGNATFNLTSLITNIFINEFSGNSSNTQLILGGNQLGIVNNLNASYLGTILGPGPLNKRGSGTLTLTNDSSLYTGTLIIDEGTIAIGPSCLIPNANVDVNGTFDISVAGSGATVTIHNLSGNNGGTVNLGNNTLNINEDSSTTLAGVISGTGSISINSTGTLNLTGDNTFTGTTTINDGLIICSGVGTVTSSNQIVVNGGTLDISPMSDTTITLNNLSGSSVNGRVTFDIKELHLLCNQGTLGYDGNLFGTGDFYKDGPDEIKLGGATGIQGNIFVESGNLSIIGTTDFSNSASMNLNNSAVLDFTNYPSNATINNLSGSNSTTLNICNREFTVTNSTDTTFDGLFSGNGTLIKNGTGTLTLSQYQSNSGPFTISNGTVSLIGPNASIASSSQVTIDSILDISGVDPTTTIRNMNGNGTVNLGDKELVVNIDLSSSTYIGQITGSSISTLTVIGSGTLNVGGNASFSGRTNIDSGTLAIIPGGIFQTSSPLNISLSGTFDISAADQSVNANSLTGDGNIALGNNTLFLRSTNPNTFNGVISGNGGINLIDANTVIFTAPQMYIGTTSIYTGTLQLNGNGSIASSALLNLVTTLDISNINNSTTIQEIQGPSSGTISLGSKTLIINSGADFSYSGTFSGSGTINKTNSNNLNLVTSSPNLNGSIIVSGGQLGLNANFSGASFAVQPGQRLYGSGTAGAFINQGTVSPGNSIGTITIIGNYTQSSTGSLEMELAADGTSDLLIVTGNVNLLSGSTINLILDPGFYERGQIFTIITAGNVTGAFTNVIQPQGAGFFLDYNDPTKVNLTFFRNTFVLADANLSPYANYMKSLLFCRRIRATGDMLNIKIALTGLSGPELAKALNDLMPDQITGIPLVELENTNRMVSLIQNRIYRFKENFCSTSKDFPQATAWITPTTFWGRQQSNGDTFSFKYNTTGFALGVEAALHSQFICGLGGGYTYSLVNWNDEIGKAHVNDLYLAPYIAGRFKKLSYSASIMGTNDRTKLNRYIQFSDINLTATSKLNGWNLVTMADTKLEIDLNRNFYFLPELSVTLAQLFRQKATEKGAGSLNFHYPFGFNSTMRTYMNLCSGFRICAKNQIAWDSKINVGYLNTQMFTNNFVNAEFIATTQVCSPTIQTTGNLPSINQGVIGFGISANRHDLIKFQFDGSYTFGGPTSVAQLNFSLEKIF